MFEINHVPCPQPPFIYNTYLFNHMTNTSLNYNLIYHQNNNFGSLVGFLLLECCTANIHLNLLFEFMLTFHNIFYHYHKVFNYNIWYIVLIIKTIKMDHRDKISLDNKFSLLKVLIIHNCLYSTLILLLWEHLHKTELASVQAYQKIIYTYNLLISTHKLIKRLYT